MESVQFDVTECLSKYPNLTIDTNAILALCLKLTVDYDESHNIDHHVAVFKNAIEIYENTKINADSDLDLVEVEIECQILPLIIYSSLLHDTIDHKYPTDLQNKIEILQQFLDLKLGIVSDNVKWIINNISYSKEKLSGYPLHENQLVQLARNIVSDADKIEALGEIGLTRCRIFTLNANPLLTISEIESIVVSHCHEKLLKLKDEFIRTSAGKSMANDGHQFLLNYVSNFEKK